MKIRTANVVQLALLMVFLTFTVTGAYLITQVYTVTPFFFFPSFLVNVNVGIFLLTIALVFLFAIAVVYRRRKKL